jgi:hypothetical protein
MLITNASQAEYAGISLTMTCMYCRKPIMAYPFYVADDRDQTAYHMTCASQLAMDILDDAAFVIEQLPKNPIKQTNKTEKAQEPGETTAMARELPHPW